MTHWVLIFLLSFGDGSPRHAIHGYASEGACMLDAAVMTHARHPIKARCEPEKTEAGFMPARGMRP